MACTGECGPQCCGESESTPTRSGGGETSTSDAKTSRQLRAMAGAATGSIPAPNPAEFFDEMESDSIRVAQGVVELPDRGRGYGHLLMRPWLESVRPTTLPYQVAVPMQQVPQDDHHARGLCASGGHDYNLRPICENLSCDGECMPTGGGACGCVKSGTYTSSVPPEPTLVIESLSASPGLGTAVFMKAWRTDRSADVGQGTWSEYVDNMEKDTCKRAKFFCATDAQHRCDSGHVCDNIAYEKCDIDTRYREIDRDLERFVRELAFDAVITGRQAEAGHGGDGTQAFGRRARKQNVYVNTVLDQIRQFMRDQSAVNPSSSTLYILAIRARSKCSGWCYG